MKDTQTKTGTKERTKCRLSKLVDHRSGAVPRNQKYKRNRGQEVYLQGRREDLAEVRKEG